MVTTEKIKYFPNGITGQWIRFALNALVLPFVVFVLMNAKAITQIEASRFTAADGAKVWEAIAKLPPRDFEMKVDSLIQAVTDLKIETAELKVEVKYLRAQVTGDTP